MKLVILRALAGVTLAVAFSLLLTAGIAWYYGEPLLPFLPLGLALALFDIGVLTFSSGQEKLNLSVIDSYSVVTLSWVVACVVGAIPFVLSDQSLGIANAIFESTSGFTTTGSTIFGDVEILPRSILFWRSLTHWLGGMGIVVLAVGILHSMGIGGLFLMQAEAPGPQVERMNSRIAATARLLWVIYFGMTAFQTVLYLFGGMDLFDAVNHAFATLATGGFSTRNASIAAFESSYIEWVTIAFMVLSGVNFALYAHIIRGNVTRVRKDTEVKAFLRAAVSKRTEWFVTRGLVEVDSSSQDKRAVQLSLTAPGESLVRDAAALLEAEFHRLFSSLEREAQVDLDAFHRTLTIVHEGLRGYNAGSPPTHAHHRGE